MAALHANTFLQYLTKHWRRFYRWHITPCAVRWDFTVAVLCKKKTKLKQVFTLAHLSPCSGICIGLSTEGMTNRMLSYTVGTVNCFKAFNFDAIVLIVFHRSRVNVIGNIYSACGTLDYVKKTLQVWSRLCCREPCYTSCRSISRAVVVINNVGPIATRITSC